MHLCDLQPKWIRWRPEGTRIVQTAAEANGIRFKCPKCFVTNEGPVGTHSIICWAPGVPPTEYPTGGRWQLVGASFDTLTLVANSSSVAVEGGCKAHFFVQQGTIHFC